ncbi:MAG: flippase [archaeon]|jgi:PST family polysaccharide transporter
MRKLAKRFLPQFLQSKVSGRPYLQKILSNMGWLTFDRFFRMGVGVIVSIWLARYLGPAEFGIWNFAIAFVALFGVFSGLGLDSIIIRELVKNPSKQNTILGTAFFLKLFASIVAIISILILSLLFVGDFTKTIFITIISSGMLLGSFDVIDFWFQSEVASKFVVTARNISFFLASVLKIVFILLSFSLIWFVLLGVFETLVSAILLVGMYLKKKQHFSVWSFDFAFAKSLVKDSWPLILSGFAVILYMRIDQVLIGQLMGDSSVGLYSAAVKIAEIWYFVPGIIIASLFPAIIKNRTSNYPQYLERLQKLYAFMFWIPLSIAIFVSIFSNQIITLLYGVEYISAAPVLSIYVWSGIFVFLGVAVGQFLLAENLTKISLVTTLLGAITNIILNLIWIPQYGMVGAAFATLISYALATFSVVIFKKARINAIMFIKALDIRLLKIF